ncbi:MAG: hypothetical protein KAT15_24560 [Bacteroidales bacterium]|nr:hypothetical protein [Bacteroidales bacterium]
MKKRLSIPKAVLWGIFLVLLAFQASYHPWTRSKPNERGVIKWDIVSYYAYLPATFIYGDVTLGFLDDEDFVNDNKFWINSLENGNKYILTTMGLSMLYSPFFFTAHLLAPLFGQTPDGYSSIYQLFLVLSSLFYVMIGLIFLKKILLRYFTPLATGISLVLVALGTNLFHYTVHEGPMSHAYNFALIIIFLYLVIRWHDQPIFKRAIWLGLVYGIIVLVRPSNIIVGTLLLFWGVTGIRALRDRFIFLFQRFPQLAVMLFFFVIPWIPQMIYWKAVSGSFLFNSYGPSGSSFYFGSPHIVDLLFSFRKGWYLYTPIMLVATVGLFFLDRKCKAGVWPISAYLVLQIYMLASWWSWWNGGSFGLRSFIDIYGIMALPLAALVDAALKARRPVAIATGTLLLFLLYMNQFQTVQYSKGVIHYTGMTREAYWLNFLSFNPDGAFWQMLSIPDAQLARLGISYTYYTGDDNAALKALEREDGLSLIRTEIEADRRIIKEIRKHAKRTGVKYADALEMAVERIYDYKASSL